MRRTLCLAVIFFAAAAAHASCGSSSCPLDLNALNAPVAGQFGFDLSFQYINQFHPMIGTHGALVGEIPTDHVEVRTTNRIATAAVSYAVSRDLFVSVSVPWISRSHFHLEDGVTPESWKLNAIGDVTLQSRYRVFASRKSSAAGLWLIGGVKLPTGPHDLRNAQGETAEVTLQPGSGTTDGIVGLSWQSGVTRATSVEGMMGNIAVIPFFVTSTYQFRAGDVGGYRLGNELQMNMGTAYPLSRTSIALFQINGRYRAKDRMVNGAFNEDTLFTGGTYVYASPGVRVDTHGMGVYALVQIPLYQKVNELQLTSRANVVIGVQHRFK